MSQERFLLRHVGSGKAWANHDGPVLFASRADALAAVLRFVCEPDAYVVAVSADDLLCEAS